MKNVARFAAYLLFLTIISVGPCLGQIALGTPPFSSMGGGPFDQINLGNLNVHFAVPVLHKTGRAGADFLYDLTYDSSVWYPATVGGSKVWTPYSNGSYWGWGGLNATARPSILTYSTTITSGNCGVMGQNHYTQWQYSNYVYTDENGTHPFGYTNYYIQADPVLNCPPSGPQPTTTPGIPASDGSGITLYATPSSSGVSASVTTRNGTSFGGIGFSGSTDSNGNQITLGAGGAYTDTLGQTALTVAGTPPSNTTLTYTPPGGTNVAYTVSYATYTVKTNFGCSGVSEYNVANTYLVDKITLPDSSFYQFTYEPTKGGSSGQVTGRLASVTLPTGGVITYAYPFTNGGTTNGINCADGTAPASSASMTRTLSPGGTWTYGRNQVSGNHWTTTVTDPLSSQTAIDFQEDSAAAFTANFYETQRKVYQGSTGGTLLLTTKDCYNNNLVNCDTTPVSTPISQVDTYTTPGGMASSSHSETVYNVYGLPTDQKLYDYGAATPTHETTTTYATLTNIADHPDTVATTDGSGNLLAKTSYGYDETAVTSTSGTQQLTTPSGSRGNATTITTYTSGSGGLTRHYSYYDTGTINQATDVNSAVTTYVYGAGSCGNSFPTSINLPVGGLSTSMTWDCVGGVQTGTTDPNGQSTSVTYTDANFWRPAKSLNLAGSQTNYSYKSPTKAEVFMIFNSSSSITERLNMVDGFGRVLTSQRRQSPTSTNYDTVYSTYDALGRVATVTMPYQGTIYQTTTTAPVTTTTYDALNRIVQVQDAASGYLEHTYTKNDDLQITGPAPAGENTKQRQMEYDGLGRLISVCEVTQGTGHVTCGQSNPLNGFYTAYTYSFSSPNVKVLVTQSGQTRTYLYDLAGRLVSEQNPENGTTTYSFDSGPDCSGTYNGDLVEREDAKGNISCYTYDGLHRVLTVSYSGPDSANTPTKNFVYDSATVNGHTMTNAKGRLAEAYTGTSGSKITDEGFVYSQLGQVAEVWESTPHSSAYYHPTATYWANNALKTTWISGLPTISYGADGEGRTSTVSATSGQNPITATSYNVSGQVTGVTFGSADSDSYGFDSNTGRMTQYKFNVSTQSVTGNTTWNPNGSLKQLVITNQLNSLDTQTCNYTHDDWARIASVDCGASKWQQNFSYDAYGNIAKTVPTGGTGIAFQAGYSSSSNWITSLPGITPTSDADGRLTYDGTHNYGWDVEGKMVTIDSTTLIHDALGRLVEKNVSGTITEFVYGPLGSKFSQMSGSTIQKVFVPLPTGTAVYTNTGLAYYRHSDHLGSSRFATTPARAMYSSTAYAPFGEPYAQAGTTDLSFAGHDQDTVVGIHDALLRKFVPVQGRWLSPDPAGLGAVDPTNPQSWNRYAYVNNNPLALVDPMGDQCYSPNGLEVDIDPAICETLSGYTWQQDISVVLSNDKVYTAVATYGGGMAWAGPNGEVLSPASEKELNLPPLPKTPTGPIGCGMVGTPCWVSITGGPVSAQNSVSSGSTETFKLQAQPSGKYSHFLGCEATQTGIDMGFTNFGASFFGAIWASRKARQIAAKAAVRTGTRAINGGGAFVGAAEAMTPVAIFFDYVAAIRLDLEALRVNAICSKQVYGGNQ